MNVDDAKAARNFKRWCWLSSGVFDEAWGISQAVDNNTLVPKCPRIIYYKRISPVGTSRDDNSLFGGL